MSIRKLEKYIIELFVMTSNKSATLEKRSEI